MKKMTKEDIKQYLLKVFKEEIHDEELYNLMQEYASEDVIFKIKSDFIPLSDVYALNSSDFIPY